MRGVSASGLPDTERLVNLTPHDIVLDVSEVLSTEDNQGQGDSSVSYTTLRLPTAGPFARVDDASGRLGMSSLNAGPALITLTRLRRSSSLTGLPPREPGTRYVVSRLTALAGRHRSDLVFPFDEIRDSSGQIVGARGLAAFSPAGAPAQRYRDWRAGARERRSRHPLPSEAWTAVLFASGTAFLSGFLALIPAAIDNGVQHGWAGAGLAWTSWLSIAFLLAGAGALGWGARRWRLRGQILSQRGTAYVIDEIAAPWQHEEKESVLTDIRRGFARTLLVPGPGALGERWQWQADADAARRWDERVDQLVRSFWAVHYNDDRVTSNALFTWAPWPVAMAFGARATAGWRALVLRVRQRPSYGAAGPRQELRLTDDAHDFLTIKKPEPLEQSAPQHKPTVLHGHLDLTIEMLASLNASPSADSPARRRAPTRGGSSPQHPPAPLLLLVRTTHEPIGEIPLDLSAAPPVTVHVPADLADPVLPTGTHTVQVAEWRLDCDLEPVPQLPWDAFPAAAEAIAEWIVAQVSGGRERVVLLGTRIPQELSVGLGIQARLRASHWPLHMYPLHFADRRLVVPNLRLGAASVPAERA